MKKPSQFLTPLIFITCALSLLLTGCASTNKKQDQQDGATVTDSYEVSADDTPFYRLGPQQESGPDLSLVKGRLVTMVKRGFGFSRVTLDNGWSGYVATADLAPATAPEPDEPSNSAIVERYYVDETPDFPPLPEQELELSTGVASPTDPEESELPRFRY